MQNLRHDTKFQFRCLAVPFRKQERNNTTLDSMCSVQNELQPTVVWPIVGKTHRSSHQRIQHKDTVLWSRDTEEYLSPETDISVADRRPNRKPAPPLPKRIHISSPTQSTSTTKHSQGSFRRQKKCHQTVVEDTHRAMQHTRNPNTTDRLLSSVKRSSVCYVWTNNGTLF